MEPKLCNQKLFTTHFVQGNKGAAVDDINEFRSGNLGFPCFSLAQMHFLSYSVNIQVVLSAFRNKTFTSIKAKSNPLLL